MRSYRKQIGGLVLTTMVLLGCAKAQSAPSKGTTPASSDFIEAFRHAHEHRDTQAMLKLFCWDGVTPEIRKMTEDYLKGSFDNKILSLHVTTEHPKGRLNEYIKGGVRYQHNLPVVLELIVDNSIPPNTDKITFYYALGIKDGHYLIAVMAPVQHTDGGPSAPSPSQPQETTQAAPGKTSQPVVVPAKTVLTVRLGSVIGVKLIDTGGTFSATISEPVEVHGVIAIPAGAPALGTVTKQGTYSPQVTLHSVTVSGTPHTIRTSSIAFSEQISYPAGAELSFELVLPLDLRK